MYPNARPKASQIPPTTLRLDPELRARLSREATIAGHSLTVEIERRLEQSFCSPAEAHRAARAITAAEPSGAPAWSADRSARLTDQERLLLRIYAELSTDKQLALLTLLGR